MTVAQRVQKARNKIFLNKARETMLSLLRINREGLGIDEIREYCEGHGIVPDSNMLWGNVVKDRRFARNGDRPSRNPRCHKRWINIWKLK